MSIIFADESNRSNSTALIVNEERLMGGGYSLCSLFIRLAYHVSAFAECKTRNVFSVGPTPGGLRFFAYNRELAASF